jgi:DNA-binding transcriptional regulator WhiA
MATAIVKTLKTIALFRIPHTDLRLQDIALIVSTQISKRFTTHHDSLHFMMAASAIYNVFE